MCKLNKKSGNRRIDPCIRDYIKMINKILLPKYETKASCCGHKKYPKTIVVGLKKGGEYCFELLTGKMIKRKKRFYKKDKQGYYYIPEVIKQGVSL